MTILLLIASVYLLVGLGAIVFLDAVTGRVRKRLGAAAHETQTLTGGGRKVAVLVTVFALWFLWPLVIYAAIFQRGKTNGT